MTNKNDWEEELFELSEKYCDHEKLGGDCLYHIFEPFIRAEKSKSVEAERERIVGILEGMKVDEFSDLPSTNVLESRMLKNLVVSQAQEKIKSLLPGGE